MSNSTTHCIYRIVCFQTGKVYVGQTNNPDARRCNHFRLLRNNKHHNIYLQAAHNKYGRSSFYFEVIEKGISPDLIDDRERYWIAYFNSVAKGYNLTEGGHSTTPKGKPCEWNGTQYETISEAARDHGISAVAMHLRLKKGYTSDADMIGEASFSAVCVWNGIEYPSMVAAAKALGIDPSTLGGRIKAGYSCDNDMLRHDKPCTWNGVVYKSITEAAKSLGISSSSMKERLSKGYLSDADMRGHGWRKGKKPYGSNPKKEETIKAN